MLLSANSVLLLLAYLVVNTLATYVIKTSPRLKSKKFAGGLSLQIAGFLMLLGLIKLFPLSILIPIVTGLLIASNSLLGHVLLKEKVSKSNILGYFFVSVGVLFIYFNF